MIFISPQMTRQTKVARKKQKGVLADAF